MGNFSAVLLLAWAAVLLYPGGGGAACFEAMLESARQETTFRAPEKSELAKAQRLFGRMFDKEMDQTALLKLKTEWEELRFELNAAVCGGRQFLTLSESPSHRTGRGFFVFSAQGAGDMLLQMPHGFRDLYTDDIGRKLFMEGRFSAAAWNTVPRYDTKDGVRMVADMSDMTETLFAALTRAFAKQHPGGHVVQLHGYARRNRRSLSGKASDMIISNGTQAPPPWIETMDRCLEDRLSIVVSRFPVEIGELGATRTSIGIVLRQMGHAGFVHLEMSKPMRLRLRDSGDARKALLACFDEALGW